MGNGQWAMDNVRWAMGDVLEVVAFFGGMVS